MRRPFFCISVQKLYVIRTMKNKNAYLALDLHHDDMGHPLSRY